MIDQSNPDHIGLWLVIGWLALTFIIAYVSNKFGGGNNCG